MRVFPEKLSERLIEDATRIYIVSGDDPLLVQESCDLIRSGLRKLGYTERELFHAEQKFDWTSLIYSGNSMSLFAEKKLMEVRLPSGKPGEQGAKVLMEVASRLNEDTVLLLVLPKVESAARRPKWLKTLEGSAAFVQVWPVEARALPEWLERRFRHSGLKVNRDALRAMAERCEGNLLAAVQEIERLKLTVGDRPVALEDVLEGVADNARYGVFLLIDTALAGHAARCLRMATGMRAEGVEPLFLVNMLAREIRSLETMRLAIDRGDNPRAVLKSARVWDKRVEPVLDCLKRHDVAGFRDMQYCLGDIDRAVKGLITADPWRELLNLLMRLSSGIRLPVASSVSRFGT